MEEDARRCSNTLSGIAGRRSEESKRGSPLALNPNQPEGNRKALSTYAARWRSRESAREV